MAVSKYDKKKLTEEQQNQIQALTASAESGVMSWDDAHRQAEAIRATADYSGGADGSEYNPFASGTNGQKQSGFSSGENQTGFDASRYTALSAAPAYGGSRADSALRAAAQNLVEMNYTDWTKGGSYKALAERYSEQGRKAMQDVLGQISARTGGLASSYAAAASQQQYNDYMAKLEDVARQMYSSERSDQMDNVNLLRSLSSDEYSRYLNRLNQWNQDRSFAYSAGRDALSDARYDDETAYNRGRDAISDARYDQQYADNRADVAWEQDMAERKYDDSRADTMYSRAKEASAPKLDLSTAFSMYASGVRSTEVMNALRYYLGGDADTASLDAAAAQSADGTAEKPKLTYDQTMDILKGRDENLKSSESVKYAVDYYLGDGYYAKNYGELSDLFKLYPDGAVTNLNNWQALVRQYGEDKLRNAGFTYQQGIPMTRIGAAQGLMQARTSQETRDAYTQEAKRLLNGSENGNRAAYQYLGQLVSQEALTSQEADIIARRLGIQEEQ